MALRNKRLTPGQRKVFDDLFKSCESYVAETQVKLLGQTNPVRRIIAQSDAATKVNQFFEKKMLASDVVFPEFKKRDDREEFWRFLRAYYALVILAKEDEGIKLSFMYQAKLNSVQTLRSLSPETTTAENELDHYIEGVASSSILSTYTNYNINKLKDELEQLRPELQNFDRRMQSQKLEQFDVKLCIYMMGTLVASGYALGIVGEAPALIVVVFCFMGLYTETWIKRSNQEKDIYLQALQNKYDRLFKASTDLTSMTELKSNGDHVPSHVPTYSPPALRALEGITDITIASKVTGSGIKKKKISELKEENISIAPFITPSSVVFFKNGMKYDPEHKDCNVKLISVEKGLFGFFDEKAVSNSLSHDQIKHFRNAFNSGNYGDRVKIGIQVMSAQNKFFLSPGQKERVLATEKLKSPHVGGDRVYGYRAEPNLVLFTFPVSCKKAHRK